MTLNFLTQRFRRRALTKPNLIYFLWRFVGNGTRTFRALTAPRTYSDTREIARELAQEGIVVRPSDSFLTDGGRRALKKAAHAVIGSSRSEAVQAIVSGAVSASGPKDYVAHLVSYPDGVIPDGPLLRVALDMKLLETVSLYLGLWPCLHSIDAWLNFPTDMPPAVSQLWHRDPEDLRIIKVFIYLSEVHDRSGPFMYVPRTHPFGTQAGKALQYERKKRVSDEAMRLVFPETSWRTCTGKPFTMILADTLGYHCGGKPTVGTRTLITFTYTSGTPITDRPFRVEAKPAWVSKGLQEFALRPLLDAQPRPKDQPKKKEKGKAKTS